MAGRPCAVTTSILARLLSCAYVLCAAAGVVLFMLHCRHSHCDVHLGIRPSFSGAPQAARAQHMQMHLRSGSGDTVADLAQLIWKFWNCRLLS